MSGHDPSCQCHNANPPWKCTCGRDADVADPVDAREKTGRIPWGALDSARLALEAARPDTREGGAVRKAVDEAIRLLDRAGAKLR